MTRSVCCTKMRALIKQLDSHACDDLIDSSSTLSPSLYSPLVIQMLFELCARAIEDSVVYRTRIIHAVWILHSDTLNFNSRILQSNSFSESTKLLAGSQEPHLYQETSTVRYILYEEDERRGRLEGPLINYSSVVSIGI
jgi:hypothetical protein